MQSRIKLLRVWNSPSSSPYLQFSLVDCFSKICQKVHSSVPNRTSLWASIKMTNLEAQRASKIGNWPMERCNAILLCIAAPKALYRLISNQRCCDVDSTVQLGCFVCLSTAALLVQRRGALFSVFPSFSFLFFSKRFNFL